MTSVSAGHRAEGGPTVAVTGATGFIGRHLCASLSQAGITVVPIVRTLSNDAADAFGRCESQRAVGDIAGNVDWQAVLYDVDVVIHAAGIAHQRDKHKNIDSLLHKVNAEATLHLAESAVESGVRGFILISSAGVYGGVDKTVAATENQPCKPLEAYSRAKLAAEEGFMSSALCQSLHVAILRPPMVYGPQCPGNLQQLARVVWSPVSAPFGAIDGRRNLLSVMSLCDGVLRILQDKGDVSGVWNIAEPDQVSVPELMKALGRGLYGKEVWVPSVPVLVLKTIATLLGKRKVFDKLNSPVLIDSRKFSQRFDWHPEVSTLKGVEQAALSFRS